MPAQGSDQENARQSRALLEQAIQALGGQTYLNIRDVQQEGRTFSFYHGRPSGTGALFWRFVEYPDKERLEVTKERDVAYVYTGNKGYEVTFKGPHAVEKKDLDDYLRHRRLSLETILRTCGNDPSVALFYEGNALAGNVLAQQLTLINSKDEAVKLFFERPALLHWDIVQVSLVARENDQHLLLHRDRRILALLQDFNHPRAARQSRARRESHSFLRLSRRPSWLLRLPDSPRFARRSGCPLPTGASSSHASHHPGLSVSLGGRAPEHSGGLAHHRYLRSHRMGAK